MPHPPRTGRLGRAGVELTAVFVFAAAVRVCHWVIVTPGWVPRSDAHQYVLLSRSLAAGDGFGLVFPQLAHHPTAFRPPLYPLLLTPGAWLFGDALWPGRLLNVLLGAAVAVAAALFARRIAGPVAGWVAGIALALHPALVANDTVTLTEPLALLLLLGAVLFVDDRRPVPAAVLTGLLLLTRPNGYLVVVVLALWAAARCGPRRGVLYGAVVIVVIMPWLVRNQLRVGTFRLTTSDGFTVAAVYGEPGREADEFVDPVFSPAYDDPGHRFRQFDEAAWNGALLSEGLDGIREEPGHVLTMLRRNAREYFEISPELSRHAEFIDGRSLRLRDAARPLVVTVLVLGSLGLLSARRDRRVLVLAAIVGQFVALSLVLVASPRLRAPLDLACCIGLGLLATAAFERPRPRGRSPDHSYRKLETASS